MSPNSALASCHAFREDVAKVADLLAFVRPSLPTVERRRHYSHMGALLADVALQTSLNYEYVVLPRVRRIATLFEKHTCTSEMLEIVEEHGAPSVLGWRHPDKPRRYVDLLHTCRDLRVETVDELRGALSACDTLSCFRQIRGIGPKSLDYLLLLAGVATIPMDRHMSWFLSVAGVQRRSYEQRRAILVKACERVGADVARTDQALWLLLRQL
jgi:hypothetical protein